uniref:Uncharacterized protein n=1 Tax=Oryza rufipogon TaxID=4529 RepID=A0A0E0P7R1_ORYRU
MAAAGDREGDGGGPWLGGGMEIGFRPPIPPKTELAFGEVGPPPAIPPNAMLRVKDICKYGDIFKKVLAEGHKWENPKELDKPSLFYGYVYWISDSIGGHFAKVAVSVDKRAYYQKLSSKDHGSRRPVVEQC